MDRGVAFRFGIYYFGATVGKHTSLGGTMTDIRSTEYAAFRERLFQARKDACLTQVEVARALGKPQSFVAKSELGERRVDALELAQFAKLYEKPIEYFLPR